LLLGLITSALVKKLDGLQEQLAKALVERAVDILDQNAVNRLEEKRREERGEEGEREREREREKGKGRNTNDEKRRE
jgi:hypothetical protein